MLHFNMVATSLGNLVNLKLSKIICQAKEGKLREHEKRSGEICSDWSPNCILFAGCV